MTDKDYADKDWLQREQNGFVIFTADECVGILAIVGFAAFSLYELQRLAAWMFGA